MAHFKTADEYIASFGEPVRQRLQEMRAIIQEGLPKAEERISYNIPAYFMDGHLIIYFAGYKNHVGMYPGRTNSNAYNQLAAQYAHGKSTARFLNSEPLPKDIIKKFIAVRLAELNG